MDESDRNASQRRDRLGRTALKWLPVVLIVFVIVALLPRPGSVVVSIDTRGSSGDVRIDGARSRPSIGERGGQISTNLGVRSLVWHTEELVCMTDVRIDGEGGIALDDDRISELTGQIVLLREPVCGPRR